jgi:hypothetical protein
MVIGRGILFALSKHVTSTAVLLHDLLVYCGYRFRTRNLVRGKMYFIYTVYMANCNFKLYIEK